MTTSSEARIEISTVCNYQCVFCPHKYNFKRKKEIMSNNLFDLILNKIQLEDQIKIITISGMGEIFLDKDIMYKISKVKTYGYQLNIVTNGSLLTEKTIDQLFFYSVDSIRISIHTTNPLEYEQITGSQKHQHVVNIIKYINNHPKKNNTKLILTADIIDINNDNIDLLKEKFFDVDLLEIWKPHNWINWKNYRSGEKTKNTCGRPFSGPLQIQVDGTVNICCFDYNGELLIGDLKKQSIKEIFNSQEYLNIKQCHSTNKLDNLICHSCDQLYASDPGIVIYNSKFDSKFRINRTSTIYENLL